MRLSDFDFQLPAERIALHPAEPRDAARMLVVRPGQDPELSDNTFRQITSFLRPGDALVFNDTKVIPARLFGWREREGTAVKVEALLHKRLDASRWLAFARPGKRLAEGDRLRFAPSENTIEASEVLTGVIAEKRESGEILIAFDCEGPVLDAAINAFGTMPLPPYIANARPASARDKADYQTIYAREVGAVAAPTAGLHFTLDLFARLDAMGVSRHFVTLHVGAGTFLPMKADTLEAHTLHTEFGMVQAATARSITEARRSGGRVIAVGTTSLRLLESAADDAGTILPFAGETDIFIKPGYRFKAVDGLITNFHLPKSTLFVLVSTFAGLQTMRRAYAHAIHQGYRFYSYGDACFLERAVRHDAAA